MKKYLKLGRIRLDGDTQPRAEQDHNVIKEYADSYASGAKMPPIIVFYDGTDYWLADGFHRWHGASNAKLKTISCDIRKGTRNDARWHSYSCNTAHGLRRTNDDKRRAVERALKHPNGAELSNVQISEHCGVGETMVRNIREKLFPTSLNAKSTPDAPNATPPAKPRKGRDGRTINTANIGRRKPKPKDDPPEVAEEEEESDEPYVFNPAVECAKLENGIYTMLNDWPREMWHHAEQTLLAIVKEVTR